MDLNTKREALHNSIASVVKSSTVKHILYAILCFALLWVGLNVLIKEPKMPTEIKSAIDSLTTANRQLELKQKALDDSLNLYKKQIKAVDIELSTIKEKTTVIREYYHEISVKVGNYNQEQVEEFFKKRYEY